MKTLVCVNVLDSVNYEVYGSHLQEWFRLGRSTYDEFILFHPNRCSIDSARNQAAKIALQYECDFLYFIDDDVILSPNTFSSLLNCKADVAQALTFIRGYPFNAMMFYKSEPGKLEYFNDYKEYINEDGIIECEAVGFSCALIKCSLLKQINPPYFVTSVQTTEDVYFCMKLREKLGESVRIVCDTKVPTAHQLLPDSISVYNREDLKEYYKKQNLIFNSENSKDRGKEYLEKCQKLFA